MASPQERSHAWLKENGWIFQKTEQTIHIPDHTPGKPPGSMRMFKRDLFGFADIVGVRPDIIGVTFFQVTAGMNNKGERAVKIEAAPASVAILRSGNTIELHIWRKLGPRGKRKLWKLARFQARLHGNSLQWIDVTEDDDFDAPVPVQSTLAL